MSKIHVWEDGVTTEREATSTEQAEIDSREAEHNSNAKKLERIKDIRLKKLKETDWWVFRGSMSTAQTNYRTALRDIPVNYNTSKYDALLARDSDGKLTHSVWTIPS